MNTLIFCLSYLHEKQTSRIQSLYLYFIKIVPFLAMKNPFLNTQQGGIQNSAGAAVIRHVFLHGKMDVKFFLMFITAKNTRSVNIVI